MASTISAPEPGAYVPAIIFFGPETDTLPTEQAKYYAYLANSGLNGLVILGTNAETFVLWREERASLVKLARDSVPKECPAVAGSSGHSTSQALKFVTDTLVLTMLWSCLLRISANRPRLLWHGLCQPFCTTSGVTDGLDLDVDTVSELAKAYPDIVGTKLTCGSIAKATCLAASFPLERFAAFGGQSELSPWRVSFWHCWVYRHLWKCIPQIRRYGLPALEGKEDGKRLSSSNENAAKGGIAAAKYAASQYIAKAAGIEGDLEALLRPRHPHEEPDPAYKSRNKNSE
ncbi:dihydrodipicolinate synthetase [Penicillium chermesinum]|uniref:Dihydrodipicolinate synthetase n=1 Tax=Penicillium chermesinum TaxID=63820 RepID=A0A9W9PK56_9EURO|nr:dihydrodipicolinate synthetase [Penicillium chermesinum]KAJ5247577.1 dihydrodipicolinate synthetase [Penicillium chermesinum]